MLGAAGLRNHTCRLMVPMVHTCLTRLDWLHGPGDEFSRGGLADCLAKPANHDRIGSVQQLC